MDAIELLKHDHRMVEQLFRDYHAAASDTQRRGVVELVIRELSKHAALEEMMVYPTAKKVLPDGAQRIDEHLSEHMAVKKLLLALDKLSAGDDREGELMSQLRREVDEHVREEEGGLFTQLRAHVSQQDLDELGRLLGQAKHTAPTRPHPGAPDQPPALTAIGPVAAAYDRLRDRLQGRPST
ncbi:hemerythrin domain-containing protein [Streptomyces sp. Li-HN-5-11]|uniref:hemerythrin domain-containing protein n=1 Tax=Streptomyces sp. Li-HN-5-11 TaxID=3075432 RepID=UPI0028A923C9|nr:hemerythrin domain-containing protein [Streptomyces sp. Li-HN-5-11]WNM32925.1 hemerythrin domain-containing protein [Streptomyces sp. Li-HN-5-11]